MPSRHRSAVARTIIKTFATTKQRTSGLVLCYFDDNIIATDTFEKICFDSGMFLMAMEPDVTKIIEQILKTVAKYLRLSLTAKDLIPDKQVIRELQEAVNPLKEDQLSLSLVLSTTALISSMIMRPLSNP